MKFSFPIITFAYVLSTSYHPAATAGESIGTASDASGHASAAVTMGVAASGQATLGVLAVPMLSVGAIGNGVGASGTTLGNASAAAAGLPASGPLPLTDKTITVTSPSEALKPINTTTPR